MKATLVFLLPTLIAGLGLHSIIDLPRYWMKASVCSSAYNKVYASCGGNGQHDVLSHPTETSIRNAMCSGTCLPDLNEFLSACLTTEAPQKFNLLKPTATGPWCASAPSKDDVFCGSDFRSGRSDGFMTILDDCNAGHGKGNEDYVPPPGTIDACLWGGGVFPWDPFPTACVKKVVCSTSTRCSVSIASYVAKCGTAATSVGLINMTNYQAWCNSPELLPF